MVVVVILYYRGGRYCDANILKLFKYCPFSVDEKTKKVFVVVVVVESPSIDEQVLNLNRAQIIKSDQIIIIIIIIIQYGHNENY